MVVHVLWRTATHIAPLVTIFSDELSIVNSSINFIIYSATSSAFRKRLMKVRMLVVLTPAHKNIHALYICTQ